MIVYRINSKELEAIKSCFPKSDFSLLKTHRQPFKKIVVPSLVLNNNVQIRAITENSGEYEDVWVDEGQKTKVLGFGKYVAELIVREEKESFLRHFFFKVVGLRNFRINPVRYWKSGESDDD